MDTKTQNIVITVLGLVLVACLWFTFSLFGKGDPLEVLEVANPIEESARNIDLDFDKVDVDIDALRVRFGDNIDSVYAAEFPEDEEVDYGKLLADKNSYAPQSTSYVEDKPAYMVIAGAFSTDANAETFRRMLMDKGFQTAEIVKFQSSKYTSICVNRTNSLSTAKSEVEQLKGMNIEAYVHTRKTSK